jgi:septal ring factor EnvC (AmiA/AmiB activator)
MGRETNHKPSPSSFGRTPRRLMPSRARLLALLGACLAVAIPVAHSGAQEIDELNSQIEGAREEAQGLAAQIESTTAELAAAQERAIAAAQREAQLSEVLARGEAREARLEAAVAAAEDELKAARAQLGRALDVLADRLVAIYRSGMPDATTILLESDGFDDLATRAEYLRRIEEADASLVGRVRSLRDGVADELATVEEAEGRAEAFTERVAAARDEIAAVRASAESEAAALEGLRAQRQAAIETLQSKVSEWTAEVQRLERISAREAQQEVANWFGDWAIPESIVMCESGGNWDAVNPSSGAGGAYQILPSTWELYGGEGNPEDASPAEQSAIAAQIWADSGASAWVCAG